jgi:acyl-[acyl carrier protein]--UDP-N-acetylglucosamine O-acyltransferase
MAAIDPTARVADGARIGDGVEVGPYCLVGPHVELKDTLVQKIIAFIRAGGKRPLMHPPAGRVAGDGEADGF